MEYKFDKSVVLENDIVKLRFISSDDKQALFDNVFGSKDTLEYYLDTLREKIEDFDIQKLIDTFEKSNLYCFSIIEKSSGSVIGIIHMCSKPNKYFNNVEIGAAIGKKYRNKGYVTSACKLFIEFMFSLGVHKVFGAHIKENGASGAVMKKCGMIFESERKEDVFYHGKYWDTIYYYILNE